VIGFVAAEANTNPPAPPRPPRRRVTALTEAPKPSTVNISGLAVSALGPPKHPELVYANSHPLPVTPSGAAAGMPLARVPLPVY